MKNVQYTEQINDGGERMNRLINNKFSIILAEKLIKISSVSRDTGISRTTLTNLYYRRSSIISFDVIDKLCNYLNCNVGDLFEFERKYI